MRMTKGGDRSLAHTQEDLCLKGYLTLRFTDGTVKRYGYNELAFWEDLDREEGEACRP